MPFIGTRKFPKGPNLKRLETHSFNLSGTKISFSAPAHNHDSIPETSFSKEIFNLYDASLFGRFKKNNPIEPASFPIGLKDWRFTGIPLLDGTGVLGDMMAKVSVVDMPDFASLFRPCHLECAVERYIYTAYTAYRISGECRMNWALCLVNDSVWVNYESNGYTGIRNAEKCYESVWHTPITDRHLLTVRFDQVIRKKRTHLTKAYQHIIDLVMSSFTIQLSQDAQVQQVAIKTQYPNERLSESLPPYEFETVDELERLELINLVSEENNHDMSVPNDIFEAQVQEKDRNQKRRSKEVKEKILNSHLRFKRSERQ